MRLAGPMQSWGANSRYTRRETETLPTKSGVIGMIAAALGLDRDESLERFRGLRFGVRADQPGTLMSDYHTAHDPRKSHKDNKDMMPLSLRYYLQDAVFLAGLESQDGEQLEDYRHALAAPHYQLFLGRRSCPPDGPIRTAIVNESLENALTHAPWEATEEYQRRMARQVGSHVDQWRESEIVIEPKPSNVPSGFVDELLDEPVSFDMRKRVWRPRKIMRIAGPNLPASISYDNPGDSSLSTDSPADIPVFDGDAMFEAVAQAGDEES
jgi:CRISPR system Cascade subunit CasD|nr:type I-E CRISPR-associated protein Cas5/CasD [Bifidobacterium tibiigranuli]